MSTKWQDSRRSIYGSILEGEVQQLKRKKDNKSNLFVQS
jgi:hypothetical protein